MTGLLAFSPLCPQAFALEATPPAAPRPASPPAPLADPPADPLERRLAAWPDWSLPAPLLQRPQSEEDLRWPLWFSGRWQVSEVAEPLPATTIGADRQRGDAKSAAPRRWEARFHADGRGGVVAERAFNARSLGRAVLGAERLTVEQDPGHPNRQLTRLGDDRLLETTVVGRRSLQSDASTFLADELSLQVLHGPGAPRVQRVEVLGRWRRQNDGRISGEQWQVSYGTPAAGLSAAGERPQHVRLRLDPLPPGSDPAS